MPKQLIIGAVGVGTELNPPLFRVIDPPEQKPSSSTNPFINPPVDPCLGAFTLVISGVVSCGCQSNTIATFSLDGTYTVSSGTLFGVGSWSAQGYSDDMCTTPIGDPASGDFNIETDCTDGLWTVSAFASDGSGFNPFASASAVAAGVSASNVFQCGTGGVEAGGGTATIS